MKDSKKHAKDRAMIFLPPKYRFIDVWLLRKLGTTETVLSFIRSTCVINLSCSSNQTWFNMLPMVN
jgi:hypothetical protein